MRTTLIKTGMCVMAILMVFHSQILNAGTESSIDNSAEDGMNTECATMTGQEQIDYIIDNWSAITLANNLSVFVDVLNDVSCAGNQTTEAIININGGSGNYIVMIDGNPPLSQISTGVYSTTVSGGTYGLTITDTDDNCMLVDNFGVGQPSAIDITAEIIAIDSCSGAIMTLDITATGGTPPYESEINPTTTGVEVVVIDSEQCEASIFVDNPPIENALVISQILVFPSDPEEENGSIDITVDGGEPPYFYQWRDEDDNILSTDEDIEDLAPGIYYVNLSDTKGCSITSGEIEVEVTTSSKFQEERNFSVYPNPVSTDYVHVSSDIPSSLNYQIFNASGALMKTGRLAAGDSRLHLFDLKAGVYYLQLVDDEGSKEIISLVKM